MPGGISPRLAEIVAALPLRQGFPYSRLAADQAWMPGQLRGRLATDTCIDRSARAIALATAGSAAEIAAGHLCCRQVAIEDFRLATGERRYDLAFAVRVGALDSRRETIEWRRKDRQSPAPRPEIELLAVTSRARYLPTNAQRTHPGRAASQVPGKSLSVINVSAAASLPLALLLSLPTTVFAQSGQSGVITYDRADRFEVDLPPEQAERLKMLPKTRVTKMSVTFNGIASVMQPVQSAGSTAADVRQDRMTGAMARLKTGSAKRGDQEAILFSYVNLNDGELVETREFLGRTFQFSGRVRSLIGS